MNKYFIILVVLITALGSCSGSGQGTAVKPSVARVQHSMPEMPLLPVIDTSIVIMPIQKTVYLDPTNGSDNNNGTGMSQAVKTFQKAVSLCNYGMPGINGGHYYNLITIAGGTHFLEGDNYFFQSYDLAGENGSEIDGLYKKKTIDGSFVYKNISLIGESSPSPCVLDGTNLTGLNPGMGVITLSGSNVFIKNITIQNSLTSRGIDVRPVRLYTRNSAIRIHDILISNVQVKNVGWFGINLDAVDKAVVEFTTVTKSCMMNEGEKRYSGYPSALKCRFSTHISYINNTIYNNWGEGLNFNKSIHCYGRGNAAYDNYAVNFYLDNAQDVVLAGNLLYNNGDDRTFWKTINSKSTLKKAATNISIANEKYEETLDSKRIFIFNNICLKGPFAFGYCDRVSGSNDFSDIYVLNNTFIDLAADEGAEMSLVNFIKPVIPGTYHNIQISNNIFTMPVHKLTQRVELARTSNNDTLLSTAGITTTNNYWSAKPYKHGRYNFVKQADEKVNPALPTDVTDLATLNNIKPAKNSNLVYAQPHSNFIITDFFGVNRVASPGSNVGAVEK